MKNRNRVIAWVLALMLMIAGIVPAAAAQGINYGELEAQIDIAKDLQKADYEDAAWAEFSDALEAAERLTDSDDQSEVDEAAENLKAAIAKLADADPSRLNQALDAVSDYDHTLRLSSLWAQMIDVLDNADDKMNSSDQAAVDAAAAELEDLLEQISDAEQDARPGVVVQEVTVKVPPSDDFCNISIHTLEPVLFFISLTLNVAIVVLIVIYMKKMRKASKDDTPLVDYDIDDDF